MIIVHTLAHDLCQNNLSAYINCLFEIEFNEFKIFLKIIWRNYFTILRFFEGMWLSNLKIFIFPTWEPWIYDLEIMGGGQNTDISNFRNFEY